MHTLEVSNLWSVSGRDERLETFLHQRGQPAAQDGLLTEQIAFGFLAESCLQHSRSRRADAVRVTERKLVSASAGVLMNRKQRRHASALRIHAAQQVPRTLRRDHHYVDIFRRLDGFE